MTRIELFDRINRMNKMSGSPYPILSIQARRPLRQFIPYCLNLARLGLWRYPLFHLYLWALLVIGPDHADRLINAIKSRLGHTPRFGPARKRQS